MAAEHRALRGDLDRLEVARRQRAEPGPHDVVEQRVRHDVGQVAPRVVGEQPAQRPRVQQPLDDDGRVAGGPERPGGQRAVVQREPHPQPEPAGVPVALAQRLVEADDEVAGHRRGVDPVRQRGELAVPADLLGPFGPVEADAARRAVERVRQLPLRAQLLARVALAVPLDVHRQQQAVAELCCPVSFHCADPAPRSCVGEWARCPRSLRILE
ncbi:hypothetical protein [Actinomadura sp. BRA 177]|uniref:hypothetical protein n=1 Tax=Actinomadura sp. BRA 177 TaxID=2745202 RepID=UPI0020CC5D58|nr:hypothetical protein [Actinomadura sp. BRA 177]